MQALKRLLGGLDDTPQPRATPRQTFDEARNLAAQTTSRQVVAVRPNLSLLALGCPTPDSLPREVLHQVHRIVPPSVRRNIAVITCTGMGDGVAHAEVGSAAWTSVSETIPFFGLLNGLGSIGHTVWIFDATADMASACRDADILIIDSAIAGDLPDGALETARRVMRASFILMHDRESGQLRPYSGGR